jgi:leucyl aminopeptidase
MARKWANTPSNDKKPKTFAASIIKAAKQDNIKTTLLSEKEISKLKMGGILGVALGSEEKPFMVILDYNPEGAKETYAFVGKGVTFDSGGINLKLGSGLEGMKFDMCGAAAAAAAVITLAKLKSKYRIIAAIPIVENMPSGNALRPGDVIKSFSGKTIEVGNTDAEGRLILSDAISYVEKEYKPKVIIDIATLTGACVVALGEDIAGVFSSDKKLAEAISDAGNSVYERCWAMPMPLDYKKLLKSGVADISNTGSSRWGGAITGALFLSAFVKDAKWAHIDIAGPASAKKASDYCEAGGTGFGVRLISDLILEDRLKNV